MKFVIIFMIYFRFEGARYGDETSGDEKSNESRTRQPEMLGKL